DVENARAFAGADRRERLPRGGGGKEGELVGRNAEVGQGFAAPAESLVVDEGEPEAMHHVVRAAGAPVPVRAKRAVVSDHPAQIAPPVIRILLRGDVEGARPHELVVLGEKGALAGAVAGRDVLPSP